MCQKIFWFDIFLKEKYFQKTDRQDQLIMPRIRGLVTLDGLSNEPAWEALKPFLWLCILGNKPSGWISSLCFQDKNSRVVSQFFIIKRSTL